MYHTKRRSGKKSFYCHFRLKSEQAQRNETTWNGVRNIHNRKSSSTATILLLHTFSRTKCLKNNYCK